MLKVVIEQYVEPTGVVGTTTLLAVMSDGSETPINLNVEDIARFLKVVHGFQIVRRTLSIQETTE